MTPLDGIQANAKRGPLRCLQGRAGVGLHARAMQIGLATRLGASPHPNPPLLHVGEGAIEGKKRNAR